MSDQPSYFAARAIEERRIAMSSADPKVRAIHLEMAAKYALLAGANPEEAPAADQKSVDVPQQKIA